MNSSSVAVIALVFLVGLAVGGAVIWFVARRQAVARTGPATGRGKKAATDLSFRLSYIALPSAVALVTVIAMAIAYPALPAEVAYRFNSSGVPQSTMSREVLLLLTVGLQLLTVVAALAVAWLLLNMARRALQNSRPPVEPGRIIWLLANMVVLPQLILSFVALDAAFYAHSQSHLMTPWLFSIVAVGIGTVVMTFLFARSFNEARRIDKES